MRARVVVGNWKMNGSLAGNPALVADLLAAMPVARAAVVVCPPAVYLAQVQTLLAGQQRVLLGAQDVSRHEGGACTGQVSAAMLRDFGVRYCLVGHSERRRGVHEGDLDVAAKAQRLLEHAITPIVCVGETLAEREQGLAASVVTRQLTAVLNAVGERAGGLVVAYEPVWAIGTGQTATPEEVQQVHALLQERLCTASASAAPPILYGGSVDGASARALLALPGVDGVLVGGAALRPAEFADIVAAAAAVKDSVR